MDALVIGEIARPDGDEIVVLAGHQMTGDDGRRGGNGLLEGLEQILVLTGEADMHDDGHAETKRLPVDARLIALNDALLLKRADAPSDCRGGKRNALGKLDLAQAAVLKQRPENRAIQRIEFDFFHFLAPINKKVLFCCVSLPNCTIKRQQSFLDFVAILKLSEAVLKAEDIMRIGVPTEIKSNEFRVGLVPGSVRELTARGHEVVVQSGAGAGIFADDDAYVKAGARILPTAEAVFAEAEMIVKVKEPQAVEYRRLKPHQILFTYLHLAPDPEQARGLMASGATAIAYETVTDANGGLPLLAPMSEVAGRLSIEAAAIALRRPTGGRGVLMGGVPGVRPAKVVVLGGGVVGTHAARMAAGLGAEVSIIDRSLPRLRQLDELFHGRVRTLASTMELIETEVLGADVVIGAVLVAGASAPKLVTRDMLPRMKRGAVLVDVSIDQGGCFETSRPTTHADPTFEVDGIIHYCVANMPGAVPVTSAQALNNATLPFVIKLASQGVVAFDDDPHLAAGLNVRDGRIMHKAVAASLGFDGASTEKVRLVAAE